MADLVPTEDIGRIVGAERHATAHIARAVSVEQTVYVLHSQECLNSGRDLRECPFSLALDNGIRTEEWYEDVPVSVRIEGAFEQTRLVPDLPPNTCLHCRGKGTLPGNNAPVRGFSPPNCWHCNGQGVIAASSSTTESGGE